jgi:membrane fusion protein (multidrug efflux system)
LRGTALPVAFTVRQTGNAMTKLKPMIIMLLAVGIVFAAVFGFEIFRGKMIQKALVKLRNPPQTVSTVVARSQPWQNRIEAVGSVRAVNGANLSFQAPGIVSAIHFQSGSDVKKGDLLVELSAADDIAHLDSLKATAALAQLNYDRDRSLVTGDAVTQQTVDTDLATLKSDRAQVEQQQALVDYKSLKAPFPGRLGIRQVDLGQYIAAGTAVVTLQQLDPIFVDFYLPQQSLARIKVGQPVTARVDTYPGLAFSGEVSSINSLVDTATRNVQVRATLRNPDNKLLPGMFVTIDLGVGPPQDYVTLPKTAIAYNSYGDIVYVIVKKPTGEKGVPQDVAEQTFVTTGQTRGDQVAIIKGVKDGDTVVSAGQVKLHNGAPVRINNEVQPADNPNPTPVED